MWIRGDVFTVPHHRAARGHEQRGPRLGVVVQADHLPLSTVLVAPTSTSARPTSFRPEIDIQGRTTRVLVEQLRALDAARLGTWMGRLNHGELDAVEDALDLVLGLDLRRAG